MATTTTPTCQEPFERESGLCSVCRRLPTDGGVRRCSRVSAQSPAMKELITRVAAIANSSASVVIQGETGSGKEVMARLLHVNSPRRSKKLVAINVAALPVELLESELFGHARGSFTGATATKQGLMEEANGGTLFLDEIAEMPHPVQAKLLRALQDGEVRRLGDNRSFRVDVRLVCATHEKLEEAVAQRRFRQDLFFRLKVFTLKVPPLRDRQEDILSLAHSFLEVEKHPSCRLSQKAQQLLLRYPWPGNVRELSNAMKHAAVLCGGEEVDVPHLPEELWFTRAAVASGELRTLAEVEKDHILGVLERCGGQQAEAARRLGIGRTTLWRKLRQLGVVEVAS